MTGTRKTRRVHRTIPRTPHKGPAFPVQVCAIDVSPDFKPPGGLPSIPSKWDVRNTHTHNRATTSNKPKRTSPPRRGGRTEYDIHGRPKTTSTSPFKHFGAQSFFGSNKAVSPSGFVTFDTGDVIAGKREWHPGQLQQQQAEASGDKYWESAWKDPGMVRPTWDVSLEEEEDDPIMLSRAPATRWFDPSSPVKEPWRTEPTMRAKSVSPMQHRPNLPQASLRGSTSSHLQSDGDRDSGIGPTADEAMDDAFPRPKSSVSFSAALYTSSEFSPPSSPLNDTSKNRPLWSRGSSIHDGGTEGLETPANDDDDDGALSLLPKETEDAALDPLHPHDIHGHAANMPAMTGGGVLQLTPEESGVPAAHQSFGIKGRALRSAGTALSGNSPPTREGATDSGRQAGGRRPGTRSQSRSPSPPRPSTTRSLAMVSPQRSFDQKGGRNHKFAEDLETIMERELSALEKTGPQWSLKNNNTRLGVVRHCFGEVVERSGPFNSLLLKIQAEYESVITKQQEKVKSVQQMQVELSTMKDQVLEMTDPMGDGVVAKLRGELKTKTEECEEREAAYETLLKEFAGERMKANLALNSFQDAQTYNARLLDTLSGRNATIHELEKTVIGLNAEIERLKAAAADESEGDPRGDPVDAGEDNLSGDPSPPEAGIEVESADGREREADGDSEGLLPSPKGSLSTRSNGTEMSSSLLRLESQQTEDYHARPRLVSSPDVSDEEVEDKVPERRVLGPALHIERQKSVISLPLDSPVGQSDVALWHQSVDNHEVVSDSDDDVHLYMNRELGEIGSDEEN